MDAVMPQPDPMRYRPTHAIFGINALIERCMQLEDTQRPTSVIIIDELKRRNVLPQGRGSMIRDIAYQHLFRPIAQVRGPFWSHETNCTLCSRLLKAGGVFYVADLDRVRGERYQRRTPHDPVPAMPPSMDMSRLGSSQIDSVQSLRASGERRDLAILCVRAKAALRGTMADGRKVVSLISEGLSFQVAVAQVHQSKLEALNSSEESGDEDSD